MPSPPAEKWRRAWREGFAPLLPTAGLEALLRALREDDPELVQGLIVLPCGFVGCNDWPAEKACAVTYCGWNGGAGDTVGELQEFFGRVCGEADERLGSPTRHRWFTNWFDGTVRDQVRRELAPEVEAELARRAAGR